MTRAGTTTSDRSIERSSAWLSCGLHGLLPVQTDRKLRERGFRHRVGG